jgi:general secretion pathway protein K
MRGVALIQVLVMTAIMSLIALGFAFSAKEQVEIARAFSDRFKAELSMRTAQSQVMFRLFKHDPIELSDKQVNGIKWNFRGQPFSISDDTTVSIQSVGGLFSLVTSPDDYLLSLFVEQGMTDSQANILLNSIKDWIDRDDSPRFGGAESQYYQQFDFKQPRNGPLQHVSELAVVKGLPEDALKALEPHLTTYVTSGFNPMLAAPELVRIVFDEGLAEQIVAQQKTGSFTEQNWLDIVGFKEFDGIETHPMSTFSLEFEVKADSVRLVRRMDIRLQTQQARDPLLVLRRY